MAATMTRIETDSHVLHTLRANTKPSLRRILCTHIVLVCDKSRRLKNKKYGVLSREENVRLRIPIAARSPEHLA